MTPLWRAQEKPHRRGAAVAAAERLREYAPEDVEDDSSKDTTYRYKSPREKERKEFKDSYQATKTQLANAKRELVKTVDAALEAEDARAEAKRGFQVICDDLTLGDVDLEQVTVASVRKLVTDAQVVEDQATTLLHYLARYVSKTYEILVQKNKKQAQEAAIDALEKKVKDMEAGRQARSVAW